MIAIGTLLAVEGRQEGRYQCHTGMECRARMGSLDLVSLFKVWTDFLADGVEGFAALLIGLAVIEATVRSLWTFAHPSLPPETREAIRLRLGRWLSLSLEFELAADILRTAIAPSWNSIGQLAAIIGLRTILNYFLQREIDKAAQKQVGIRAVA